MKMPGSGFVSKVDSEYGSCFSFTPRSKFFSKIFLLLLTKLYQNNTYIILIYILTFKAILFHKCEFYQFGSGFSSDPYLYILYLHSYYTLYIITKSLENINCDTVQDQYYAATPQLAKRALEPEKLEMKRLELICRFIRDAPLVALHSVSVLHLLVAFCQLK